MYNKAFIGGFWQVLYKTHESEKYKVLRTPDLTWAADPFLFENAGKHYLFVELYHNHSKKASIAYYEFENGDPIFRGIIVDEPYHISYPCVFSYDDRIYMIPESAANHSVDLYIARSFPDIWIKDKTLLNGNYVDSTVLMNNSELFLFSYINDKHYIEWFKLNMQDKKLIKICEKKCNANTGRSAGNFFFDNDCIYRYAQDNSIKYGEKIIVNLVEKCDGDGYNEIPINRIDVSDLLLSVPAQRVHTINKDGVYDVIDVYLEQFDLLKWWKIFRRKHKV